MALFREVGNDEEDQGGYGNGYEALENEDPAQLVGEGGRTGICSPSPSFFAIDAVHVADGERKELE